MLSQDSFTSRLMEGERQIRYREHRWKTRSLSGHRPVVQQWQMVIFQARILKHLEVDWWRGKSCHAGAADGVGEVRHSG